MKESKERTLLRVYVEKSDQWMGRPLYEAVVAAARRHGIAGATAYAEGLTGYGCKSQASRDAVPTVSKSSPVIVEMVDRSEKMEALIAELKPMVKEGFMLTSRVDLV